MGLSWPTIQSVHDHMYFWYEYCLCCILIWFHNHCLGRLPRYVYGFSAWVCIYVNVIMCTRVCLLLLISVDMRQCVCVCFSLSFGASRSEVSPRASSSHTPLLSQFPPCEAASPPPPFPLHLASLLSPLLLPSLATTLWIKQKLMQMKHSLSHCLLHSGDGNRDDSNIGENTLGKLLASLRGAYAQYAHQPQC